MGIRQDNAAGHPRFALEKRGGQDLAARRKADAENTSIAARHWIHQFCGLSVHFQLLSNSPRGDAVTFR